MLEWKRVHSRPSYAGRRFVLKRLNFLHYFHLTQCMNWMVLESWLSHDIVNLLYSQLMVNSKSTILWGGWPSKIIWFIHCVRWICTGILQFWRKCVERTDFDFRRPGQERTWLPGYPGLMKVTTHLYHITRCRKASGKSYSNRRNFEHLSFFSPGYYWSALPPRVRPGNRCKTALISSQIKCFRSRFSKVKSGKNLSSCYSLLLLWFIGWRICVGVDSSEKPVEHLNTLEATQGQIDGFFSQLPCKYH